jgi:hypothetical protein
VRNFRQALASPHPGRSIHDSPAAFLMKVFEGAEPMTKLIRVCSVVILTAVVAAGCAARGVRIAELRDRPDKYSHKTVSVEGVVTGSIGGGVLGLISPVQGYKVDDGTGEITVISTRSNSVVPRTGARVRVKGKVNELGSFGGRSIGLHLQEGNRKIKS